MSGAVPVSLVVVSHGRRAELALLLKALEFQRGPGFELIVVSDLAPEARPASGLSPHWIRFTERNISAARNLGLARAGGAVVAFIDDDSVPEFGWLDHLVRPFDDPEVGAAGGYVRGRNGVDFQFRCMMGDRFGRVFAHPLEGPSPVVFPPDPGRYPATIGTNCAFRAEALRASGGFDERYKFFLEETDANLRLTRAGWRTAIVPMAQVHHGFAGGPHRTWQRVPTSLFEIGASKGVFLQTHAPPDRIAPETARFRREHARRLMAHFELGRVSSHEMSRLLADLDAGLEDGAARPAVARGIPADAVPEFAAPLRSEMKDRHLLVARTWRARGTLKEAQALADDGQEVTVLLPEPSPRPIRVSFDPGGYFRHRFGVFGRMRGPAGWPPPGRAGRVALEAARLEPLRGPFSEAD